MVFSLVTRIKKLEYTFRITIHYLQLRLLLEFYPVVNPTSKIKYACCSLILTPFFHFTLLHSSRKRVGLVSDVIQKRSLCLRYYLLAASGNKTVRSIFVFLIFSLENYTKIAIALHINTYTITKERENYKL